MHPVGYLHRLPVGLTRTGPVGPIEYFRILQQSEIVIWANQKLKSKQGDETTVYFPQIKAGRDLLLPGEYYQGLRGDVLTDKLNFVSLMLALFCGTASLPHILIRYYTVKDELSARRSTIVGIGTIGLFYVLTLYLGLGAMTTGSLDVTDSNMAAPLLAKGMNELLFAVISAIAFTTVLGTVSGLILAASGAVTHDVLVNTCGIRLTDTQQVRVAKITSVFVGAIAIALGILFRGLNVGYLVGWAFSVAASANLPALIMLLFWQRTTHQGVTVSIIVGMVSSLTWILLSADTFTNVFGWSADSAIAPFSQPGIVTIPLGFLTVVVVSLLTRAPEQIKT